MKTLKTSIFALATMLLLFACNEDENPGPGGRGGGSTGINPHNFEYFDAFFKGDNPLISPYVMPECGSSFRFEFQGEGVSNLLGQFSIIKKYCFSSHRLGVNGLPGNDFHSEGEFTLTANETGDTISGNFNGDVSFYNGENIIREELSITGGTGKYEGSSGHLVFNASGSGELSGNISGNIRLKTLLP